MQNNFDAIKIKIIRQESAKRSLSNRERERGTQREMDRYWQLKYFVFLLFLLV